jgi:predicted DNA-binding protein with PD1-like motif
MRNQKYENVYAVRIDKGEEIVEKLKELCRTENIRFAQVSAIGASEHAVLGVYDLAKQEYARESVSGFCEITSLSGSITTVNEAPYIHLHAMLADQQHQIHGGNLLELTVGAICEMFIRAIDTGVGRIHDDQLGINLCDI